MAGFEVLPTGVCDRHSMAVVCQPNGNWLHGKDTPLADQPCDGSTIKLDTDPLVPGLVLFKTKPKYLVNVTMADGTPVFSGGADTMLLRKNGDHPTLCVVVAESLEAYMGRTHMDCYSGGSGCLLGQDATCPMREKAIT